MTHAAATYATDCVTARLLVVVTPRWRSTATREAAGHGATVQPAIECRQRSLSEVGAA